MLPPDAALLDGDAAQASAIGWASSLFAASDARVVASDLLLVRDARVAQQKAAGSAMPIWDPTTEDVPVWLVKLVGTSFRFPDCPDCPTGSSLLLTIRALDGGMYWAAIGSGGPANMTQVVPYLPRDGRTADEATPQEMGRAALDYPRDWVLYRQGDIEPESGEPEVVVAKPATASILRELGLGDAFGPTCQRPFYIVILHGDFAGDIRYITYVFDLSSGPPGAVMQRMASPTDEPLRHILGGPPPTPMLTAASPEAEPEPDSSPWPCDDIWLPGPATVPDQTPPAEETITDAGAWRLVVMRANQHSVAAVVYGETTEAAIAYTNAVREIGERAFDHHESIPALITFAPPISPERFAALMNDAGARVTTYRARTHDDHGSGTMQMPANPDGSVPSLPAGGWTDKDGTPRQIVGIFDAEVVIDVETYRTLADAPEVFLINIM